MKRNSLVLLGLGLVIIGSLFLPVITFSQETAGLGKMPTRGLFDRSTALLAILMWLVMLLPWKWRGGIWIVLGILGLIWTPFSVGMRYLNARQIGSALAPPLLVGLPVPSGGFLLIVLGYILTIVGARGEMRPGSSEPPPH